MNFKTRFVRDRVPGLKCDPAGDLARQEFKEECDVNHVVSCYMRTGSVPGSRSFTARYPQFGDFSGVRSVSEALLKLDECKAEFLELPTDVRKRFGNDPRKLYSFLQDENNRPEAEKLGLVDPKPRPVADQPPIQIDPVHLNTPQPEAAPSGEVLK